MKRCNFVDIALVSGPVTVDLLPPPLLLLATRRSEMHIFANKGGQVESLERQCRMIYERLFEQTLGLVVVVSWKTHPTILRLG